MPLDISCRYIIERNYYSHNLLQSYIINTHFPWLQYSAMHVITVHGFGIVYYSDVIMGVSNHQPQDCLLNRLFMRRSKKTSKLRVRTNGQ